MKFVLAIFAGLLALTGATSGNAQLAPKTSGYSTAPVSASKAEYWIMVSKLGLCLADARRDKSQAFLSTIPGSAMEDAAFDELFHRDTNYCMGNFVSATIIRSHIRGSVAEGFVTIASRKNDDFVSTFATVQPKIITSIHGFAACYVSENPLIVYQFLDQTKVGSKGEREALQQMSRGFGACLPNGFEAKLTAIDIRMALAEATYHVTSGKPGPFNRSAQ